MDLRNNPFEQRIALFGDVEAHDHPPALAFEYEALRAQCRDALARRKATYPELVRKNQIDADLARRDIAAWQQLLAEWHWVITGDGDLPEPATLPERVAAVDLAARRIRDQIARSGGNDDLWRQQSAVAALAWHLARLRHGIPTVHHLADLTRRLRASRGIVACAACDRRAEDPAVRACTRSDCGLTQRGLAA